jgi:hypothetical protein
MRIERFYAKGFRSLEDVDLRELGPFNVFYGRNGAGKSNILAAIDLLFRALAARVAPGYGNLEDAVLLDGLVDVQDFSLHRPERHIVLGAWLVGSKPGPLLDVGDRLIGSLQVEVEIRLEGSCRVHISQLSSAGEDCRIWWSTDLGSGAKQHFRRLIREVVATTAFRLVPANRTLIQEAESKEGHSIRTLLDRGAFKEALATAQLSPDPFIRRRLQMLRDLLAGEPLHRPPFVPVIDPQTRQYALHEELVDLDGTVHSLPLELRGLGLQQLYLLLGHTLLGASFAVGLEEPEAHLHAPTSGRELRILLQRVVKEGMVQQLFIATHSNLFDLDETGWFDVSLENGATRVTRRTDLAAIDRDHLYEPGPARHGLQDMLRYLPPDIIVFRRAADGSGITATEMLDMLQRDTAEAVDFLRDVHGAAVRAVQIRASQLPHLKK